MTTIFLRNNQAEICNDKGVQIVGKSASDSDAFSPKELLEASVGLCVSLSLQKMLKRDGHEVDPSAISIDVTASKDEGVANRFTKFDIQITLPEQFDQAYKRKLLVSAERGCIIGNTLKGVAHVELVERRLTN